MLSLIVFLPLAVALVVAAVPAIGPATSRWVWVAVSVVELVLVGVLWAGYEDPGPNALAFEEQVPWIPGSTVATTSVWTGCRCPYWL